jgi:hypothetical protein
MCHLVFPLFSLDFLKAASHIPCRSPAMPCHRGFKLCLSHLIYTVGPCLIHTRHGAPMPFSCHYTTMPFSRPRHNAAWVRYGHCMAWHVRISIGCPETAFGRPARFRFLPATTRNSTKVVTRSIPIR